MNVGDRFEKFLAEEELATPGRNSYTFVYPLWLLAIKVVISLAAGGFAAYVALVEAPASPPLSRLVAFGTAVTFLIIGLSAPLGLREITIAEGAVTIAYGSGRRTSWPLPDLEMRSPIRQMNYTGAIAVRSRTTGRVAFKLPRDFPRWKQIAALIPPYEQSA